MDRRGFLGGVVASPLTMMAVENNEIKETTSEQVSATLEEKIGNTPIIIRIWKLDYPTDRACDYLRKIISEWDGSGPLDIMWDDTLTLEQHVVSNSDEIKEVVNIIKAG